MGNLGKELLSVFKISNIIVEQLWETPLSKLINEFKPQTITLCNFLKEYQRKVNFERK